MTTLKRQNGEMDKCEKGTSEQGPSINLKKDNSGKGETAKGQF